MASGSPPSRSLWRWTGRPDDRGAPIVRVCGTTGSSTAGCFPGQRHYWAFLPERLRLNGQDGAAHRSPMAIATLSGDHPGVGKGPLATD